LGLTAGPVPARVEGPANKGLLDLVEAAREQGFSGRWAWQFLVAAVRRTTRVGIEPEPSGITQGDSECYRTLRETAESLHPDRAGELLAPSPSGRQDLSLVPLGS
jgi:hypothetical protein